MAVSGGVCETLNNIPDHVWRGLPDNMSLSPSAVNPNRIGVWASGLIPKGTRFGPFIGERKKRSQVTSNVYMWEVYFPARGWLCVDATDPLKGNWLRYVNWARCSQEQNLFPLEINRAVYYKALRPIGAGEELLVWYNGEESAEIAAALEEERSCSSGKKHSPRAKRAKKKLLEKAREAGLEKLCENKPSIATKPTEMRDSEEGVNKEEDGPSAFPESSQETEVSHSSSTETKDSYPSHVLAMELEQKEDEEVDHMEMERLHPQKSPEHTAEAKSVDRKEQPNPQLIPGSLVKESSPSPLHEAECVSSVVSPELDAEGDPDFEDDAQGGNESHPCQHCERHFSTKQGLERHTHIHTIANHQTHTFKCKYCSKPFGSQVGRRRHERRHENGSKSLKKPCSLAGTAFPLSPSRLNDSPPTSDFVASLSPTIMSSQNGPPQPGSDVSTKDAGVEPEHTFVLDENGESKELHPCKYCNKAFGTHTNMRRHQRRIHERHLMPKGVRKKGILLQDMPSQQLDQDPVTALQKASPNVSPPPVYVPSVDTEDEGEREEGMVDISKNISENLSLYIDGKILSTNTVSSCEVIEVDSSTAALFGLDTVILNTNQISQALKVETHQKEVSVSAQLVPKRRTSTPPLLPAVKMESETLSSASSSSCTSSQSPLLVGNVFPQSTETLAFPKEKTIYLSPKLKQLLQTQDSQKPALTLIADSHRLTTPLSVTSLPAVQGRFKRRTASPPTPAQSSSSGSPESSNIETGDSFTLKVPKVESHCTIQSWSSPSNDQRDSVSPSGKDWSASISGGNSCNQQPLDLSSAVGKRDSSLSKGSGESVLDLSVQRKGGAPIEAKAGMSLPPHAKRKKPNTSMLEKVLMNEYAGLSVADDEGCASLESPDAISSPGSAMCASPASPCSNSENPPCESSPPPSLTPVTINPSSPSSSSLASSTPPPPVLPSVPSPPPLTQSPDSFPKLSPKPIDHPLEEMTSNVIETCHDMVSLNVTDFNQTAKQLDPMTNALPQSPQGMKRHCKADSFFKSETLLKGPASDAKLHLKSADSSSSCERCTDSEDSQSYFFDESFPPDLNIKTEECQNLQPSISSVHFTPGMESPSPTSYNLEEDSRSSNVGPSTDNPVVINEHVSAEKVGETAANTDDDPSSASSRAAVKSADTSETSEQETFTKSFVCNVCEQPFHSIKELSSHITQHAVEWPFKCEFCVQLFGNASALLEHRSSLHGVGRIYICSVCSKEFAYLCNLQQHQTDLHPGQSCAHTSVENGKLRPQNYTDPAQADIERKSLRSPPDTTVDDPFQDSSSEVSNGNDIKKEDSDEAIGQEDPTEELYTTIKIMASEAGKPKGPDVRLGINQHYPSFKPPPFPYHNRTPAGTVASATNFTTHNIPQTFSTAIRCTKCGKSFDNMPELHKHILACANASDKRRYTPKKNPIPLRQIVKQPQNGAISTVAAVAATGGQNAFRRMGQPKRLNFNQEIPPKMKMTALNKKKNQLVQKAISHKNKAAASVKKASIQVKEEVHPINVCPYCGREFTYPASLSKHVACSCPQKPVAKKAKGVLTLKDKNKNLRSRATDSEIKQESDAGVTSRPLGKTRARNFEPIENEVTPASKGKTGMSQVRAKRPASSISNTDNTAPKSKKGRKSNAQPVTATSSSPPGSDASARSATKAPRLGKHVAPKKKSEKLLVQTKKEERFSKRTRERVGGPVTRSLQISSSAEEKNEDPQASEPGPGE